MNIVTCIRRTPCAQNLRNVSLVRSRFEQPFIFSSVSRKFSIVLEKHLLQNQIQIVTIQHGYFSDSKGSIVPKSSKQGSEVSTSLKETVKETTKTTFNSLIIIAGIGVTSLLFYAIFRELFSGKSPNNVYSKAFEKCIQDTRVQDALGEPIKGHGETTRRGRRRHVSHVSYIKDNIEHMRMVFYLKGSRKNGTVHLEVIEGAGGDYDYRYLFVQLDEWPNKVIVLEDNRHDRTSVTSNIQTPLDIDSSQTFKFS